MKRLTALLVAVACVLPVTVAASTPAHAGPGVDLTLTIGSDGPSADATPTVDGAIDLEGAIQGVIDDATVDLSECEVALSDPRASLSAGTGTIWVGNCAGSDFGLAFNYVVTDGGSTLVSTSVTTSNGAAQGPVKWSIDCDVVWVLGFWPVVKCKIRVSSS